MANKRPVYYDADAESAFFRNTPKHVLYALARDYALQVLSGGEPTPESIDAMLADMGQRIGTLQSNQLLA